MCPCCNTACNYTKIFSYWGFFCKLDVFINGYVSIY
nr:unnamed protein product [Callosobruchus chinensis]